MPSLYLGSRRIEYDVVRGSSSRYTYFRIRPDLTLEVVIPRGGDVNIERTIRERAPWLMKEYERMSKACSVLDGESVMLGGRLLKILFSEGDKENLMVDEGRGCAVARARDRNRIKELVRRWFLAESSAYAVRKVAELSPRVGARPSRVDVREIKKWGYCTRTGRISFSWQLAALPERLREYVVLHELTHLLEFNHSAAFKRRLESVCPDFRERSKELDRIAPYDGLSPP